MVDALTGWLMPCGRRCAGHRAGFAEVRKAEASQGQGDCQAGPGREVRVRAWLSAIARLRESHGASWGRVALRRVLRAMCSCVAVGGGVLIAAYVTSYILSIAGAVSGAKMRDVTIEGCFHTIFSTCVYTVTHPGAYVRSYAPTCAYIPVAYTHPALAFTHPA